MNSICFIRRPASGLGAAIVLSLSLSVAACSDSPTGPDDDDHVEASGFAIELDGQEVLRYLDGGVLANLQLTSGNLYEAVIVFLDENGDPVEHEGEEEEDALRMTIGNGAILTWEAEEHDPEGEEHEHLEFHGELTAVAAGGTQMQLCILHEGHCDYESPSIQVAID